MTLPAREYSLDYKFEELSILPAFTGADGRSYHYADAYVSGTAEIIHDADGDWWVSEISLETTERVGGYLSVSPRKFRKVERTDPVFGIVKAALERENREHITEAIREHLAEEPDAFRARREAMDVEAA